MNTEQPSGEQAGSANIDADYDVLHRNIGLRSQRLDALSDAIYAVALTLLVLDLRLPAHAAGHPLSAALRQLLPHFITYTLSFVTLSLLWVWHLLQSHWIERLSRTYIWMKIVFLMFLVLVPFSTQALAAYDYDRLGVMLYGLNYLVCTTLLLSLWSYATNGHRLIRKSLDSHVITWLKARMLVAIALAVIALLVALTVSTRAGAALFIAAQIVVIFPTWSIDRLIIWLAPHLQHSSDAAIAARKGR